MLPLNVSNILLYICLADDIGPFQIRTSIYVYLYYIIQLDTLHVSGFIISTNHYNTSLGNYWLFI